MQNTTSQEKTELAQTKGKNTVLSSSSWICCKRIKPPTDLIDRVSFFLPCLFLLASPLATGMLTSNLVLNNQYFQRTTTGYKMQGMQP
jgi:hypothetical protein